MFGRKFSTRAIPWVLPDTEERINHYPVDKLETATYTLRRACTTGRLWLLDTITVGLFALIVIGVTEGRCKPSDRRMGFTMRTHFLDLAMAALSVMLSPVYCMLDLGKYGDEVAEQLYSFILTVLIGLGARSASAVGW